MQSKQRPHPATILKLEYWVIIWKIFLAKITQMNPLEFLTSPHWEGVAIFFFFFNHIMGENIFGIKTNGNQPMYVACSI